MFQCLFYDFVLQVIDKLPESRWNNIRYLIKFFHELSRRHEHNKMTCQNLAIVLAPSLLWSPVIVHFRFTCSADLLKILLFNRITAAMP